jgi:hypothetical protein
MDPDMNNYGSEHVCTAYPLMSKQALTQVYLDAWKRYYTDPHVETIMGRAIASGFGPHKMRDQLTAFLVVFSGAVRIEGVHPLQFGLLRRKVPTQRRYGMPIPNPLVFYPSRLIDFWKAVAEWVRLLLRYRRIAARVLVDPNSRAYGD